MSAPLWDSITAAEATGGRVSAPFTASGTVTGRPSTRSCDGTASGLP